MSSKKKASLTDRMFEAINRNCYKFLFYFVCVCYLVMSSIYIYKIYSPTTNTTITFANGGTFHSSELEEDGISNEQHFKQLIDPECAYAIAYYSKNEFDTVNVEKTYSDKLININTASAEELQKLPGIGENRSLDIIEYRNTYGKFDSIEELMSIDGIGDGIFSKIQYLICAE